MRRARPCKTIQWAAGLYEGEGSAHAGVPRVKNPYLSLQSTDRDVLLELQKVVGGYVNGPYIRKSRPRNKPVWTWVSHRGAAALATKLLPYLCSRRASQVRKAFRL